MSVDKLVDSSQLDADLTSVANAIRAKSGGSGQLAFPAGFVSEIGNISGGGGSSAFELVDTIVVQNVPDWTSTTGSTTDTQYSVTGLDGTYYMAVITCDTQISTSTEWGMSACCLSRNTNGNITSSGAFQQKGTATLDFSALSANVSSTSSYGVSIDNNKSTIQFTRKCYSASSFQIIRGGTYRIKLYELKSL